MSKKKEFQLEPCPYCGCVHVWIINENITGVPKYAECDRCQARTRDCYTEEEAVERWNRRVKG